VQGDELVALLELVVEHMLCPAAEALLRPSGRLAELHRTLGRLASLQPLLADYHCRLLEHVRTSS